MKNKTLKNIIILNIKNTKKYIECLIEESLGTNIVFTNNEQLKYELYTTMIGMLIEKFIKDRGLYCDVFYSKSSNNFQKLLTDDLYNIFIYDVGNYILKFSILSTGMYTELKFMIDDEDLYMLIKQGK